MREGGRIGAGLIYPRFEAIRLASRPTATWGGSFLPSSPSREEGFVDVERALPRTLEGQSPSHFSACWLCGGLIDNDFSVCRPGRPEVGRSP